jgi:hypothetical protein
MGGTEVGTLGRKLLVLADWENCAIEGGAQEPKYPRSSFSRYNCGFFCCLPPTAIHVMTLDIAKI